MVAGVNQITHPDIWVAATLSELSHSIHGTERYNLHDHNYNNPVLELGADHTPCALYSKNSDPEDWAGCERHIG